MRSRKERGNLPQLPAPDRVNSLWPRLGDLVYVAYHKSMFSGPHKDQQAAHLQMYLYELDTKIVTVRSVRTKKKTLTLPA